MIDLSAYKQIVRRADTVEYSGRVARVTGLMVESTGPASKIGDVCQIHFAGGQVQAEVVGFRDRRVLLMPYGETTGISQGDRVVSTHRGMVVPVGMNFLGRTVDALCNPIDGLGPIAPDAYYPIENDPPTPMLRERIHEILPLGVKAIDGLLTVGRGQRIGIFSGSGVGKSTLMGMIARNGLADINVIALVGERGREVRDFIEKDLKEEGLRRSILVVATSDQPALLRMKSALVGTAIAEYFRDKGYKVLLLMDSLTRFAMAQRDIGMSTGEAPVSRGYTPSVFAKLPRLLERSGNSDIGSITALYTVLVEGDDMNEPISDTVRGILDGHFVLTRALANSNHFPALDVLASVSRLMPDIVGKEHFRLAGFVKNMMAVYRDSQDLISIGAYKQGSNAEIDTAISLNRPITAFLKQDIDESCSFDETISMLEETTTQNIRE